MGHFHFAGPPASASSSFVAVAVCSCLFFSYFRLNLLEKNNTKCERRKEHANSKSNSNISIYLVEPFRSKSINKTEAKPLLYISCLAVVVMLLKIVRITTWAWSSPRNNCFGILVSSRGDYIFS